MKRKNKTLLCVIMAASLLLATLAVVPMTALADGPGQVTLTVKQIFKASGYAAPPNKVFTYRLTPKEAPNPMPGGANSYTFTVTGTGEAQIGPITFGETGTYTYEIRCVTAAGAGYTVDSQVYTIEICVTRDLTLISIVYISDGVKADEIIYEHSYNGGKEPDKPQPSPQKPDKPDGPKTDDEARAELYIAMISIAGVALLGIAIYLLAGKRRRREADGYEA